MTPDPIAKTSTAHGGLRAVAHALRELARTRAPGVLAVVAETSGSTYRKPGAMIVLDERGVCAGALSGGCLEADLERRAREVLAGGEARACMFDTRGDEDRVFGSGTGCGGSLRVLLLPLPAAAAPLRDAIIDADRRGASIALRLRDEAPSLGCGAVRVVASGIDAIEYAFDARGDAGDEPPAEPRTLALTIARAARVLVCGAGPESAALVAMAHLQGWHVELVEHRHYWRRFAAGVPFDDIHADGAPSLTLAGARDFDAALVMTHNFDLDAQCLTALAPTAIGFIGLLGPAARRDALFGDVGDDVVARLGARLRAPIGLALGGEGAEAIALSIVAGLRQHFSRTPATPVRA